MNQTISAAIALRLEPDDRVPAARALINGAMTSLSTSIMRQWLAMPAEYDIDIEITMTAKGLKP